MEEVEKLKKELNYLRQYKEALDKIAIISKTDTTGIIKDVNKAFEKISGFKKEELLNKPHNIIRHPDMPKAVFKKMWDTIKKGKIFKGVIKNRAKNGSEYYVIANVIPIKNEKGEIEEYLAIRQDITKQMKLQQQKENFTNNLIEYFLKKINTPTDKIKKYTFLIEQELSKEKPSLKEIKKLNSLIKENNFLLLLTKKILSYLLKINKKTFKISKEDINLISVIQYAYNPLSKIFKNKIKFILKSKKILEERVKSDKKLLALMFQILFFDLLKYSSTDIEFFISCEKEIEIKIKFTSEYEFNLTSGFKTSENIELNADMFFVSKIARILAIEIKTEKGEITIIFNKK